MKKLFGNAEPEPENDQIDQADLDGQTMPLDPEIPEKLAPPKEALHTRPLAPLPEFETTKIHVTYGIATHVGMVREKNQDAASGLLMEIESDDNMPPLGLFVVADGMGGHMHGERASATALYALSKHFVDQLLNARLSIPKDLTAQKNPLEVLMEGIDLANDLVHRIVPNGGTTMTAVALKGDTAYIAHVGDSRAYVFSEDDGLEQLTRDHSLVRRMVELGELSADEADGVIANNILYMAIGSDNPIRTDSITRQLRPNSKMVICSDGLWNMIDERDIVQIIKEYDTDPQKAANVLVEAANANGGEDNISVIVIRLPDSA